MKRNLLLTVFFLSYLCLPSLLSAEESSKLSFLKNSTKQVETSSALPSLPSTLGNIGKGLAYSIAAFLALMGLYKKLSKHDNGADSNRIQVLSRKVLGPRSEVVLVSVDGVKLLLSHNAEDTSLLSEIDPYRSFEENKNKDFEDIEIEKKQVVE